MKKYAVLIGNSEFPDEPDKRKLPTLACPEQDVDDLAAVLADVNRGEFEVLRLKNQASHLVLRKLQQTIKQLQADDLLLVYYSGHGKPNKNNILHLTTFDTVISELESTAIPIHRVYDIIATGKAKKIIIILDCCYSGAAGQGFRGDINDGLQQLNNSRGTYLVTASTELQVAHENTSDGYGLFTKHLIAGLTTGAADKDGDGFISMNELYDYVHDKVIAENPNQQPTKHVKDERGSLSLIIAKSGRDSRKDRAEKIRLLLLEFEKQHEDIAEIKIEALVIAKTEMVKLSPVQLEKDQLLTDLLNDKIFLLSFVRTWDRLATKPTEKPAKPKLPDIPVKKPHKRKIILTISSMAVVFSLMGIGGWQFISSDNNKSSIAKTKTDPTPTEKPETPTPNPSTTSALKDETITVKGVDFEMLDIKGGTFQMGSPATEPERGSDEKQHEVTVSDFQMGKYEVTQKQWQTIMDTNPSSFKGDDLPVESVSWDDVQVFLSRLNQATEKTGHKFHLPTEAQWEYAARAGTNTPFYPYDGKGDCITTTYANFDSNYDYNGCGANTKNSAEKTVKVGSYQANAFGLFDMAGNLWEWTCSAYVGQYDGNETKCISKNDANTRRVLRGGSWYDEPSNSRLAYRYSSTPDARNGTLGFRLALGQTAS
jgi:formylglycine-generating enzyme required for sulfatase activity